MHAAFRATTGVAAVGDMHKRQGIGDIVESMVVDADKREALGFGPGPQGWIITARINDPDSLADVVAGEKRELSLRGWGEPVYVGDGQSRVENLRLNLAELVSIVDRGASGNESVSPRVVLIKRCGAEMEKATMPMSPEERAAALEQLKATLGEEMFAVVLRLIEEAAMPPAGAAATPIVAQKTDDEDKEMQKRLRDNPELADAIKRLEARNEELSKRLVTTERENRERIALEKVRSDYASVPGASHEELARLIQRCDEALESGEREVLIKILKCTHDAVGKSELLRSHGAGGEGSSGGGYLRLRELAKQRQSDKGESYGIAYQRVCEAHPDLYTEARSQD